MALRFSVHVQSPTIGTNPGLVDGIVVAYPRRAICRLAAGADIGRNRFIVPYSLASFFVRSQLVTEIAIGAPVK